MSELRPGLSITDLSGVGIDALVECMLLCFQDYFVPFGGDSSYWGPRFENSGVDYSLSMGVFGEDNMLIGFVVTAIQDSGDRGLQAYNAATGVLPAYRGQHLVDHMYEFGIPLLKARGVSVCSLEVIVQNEVALKAYGRVGFRVTMTYLCYRGYLPSSEGRTSITEDPSMSTDLENPFRRFYSWDNRDVVLRNSPGEYVRYLVTEKATKQSVGFFVISPATGNLSQFEIYNSAAIANASACTVEGIESDRGRWVLLFDGIAQVSQAISIKNVSSERKILTDTLEFCCGMDNFVNQYEMSLVL